MYIRGEFFSSATLLLLLLLLIMISLKVSKGELLALNSSVVIIKPLGCELTSTKTVTMVLIIWWLE